MEKILNEWEEMLAKTKADPTDENIIKLAEKAGDDYDKKMQAFFLTKKESELEKKLNAECTKLRIGAYIAFDFEQKELKKKREKERIAI